MTTLGFTPAKEQDVFKAETGDPSTSQTGSILSGEEARKFYENLMKDDKGVDAVSKIHDGRDQQTRSRNRESRRRGRRRVRASEMQQLRTDPVVVRRDSDESRETTASETSNSERNKELRGLRLLRCAHEGDLSSLRELISQGVDINFQVH